MKFNKRGFLLAETLIVATFITSTLIFLFIQVRNISSDYDITFKYNTIEGLYATDSIIKFLHENIIYEEASAKLTTDNYINLSYCPFNMLYEVDFCTNLLAIANVKSVIIATNNPGALIDQLELERNFNETFINFVKYIKFESESFRIIVEFNDDSYATLPFKF